MRFRFLSVGLLALGALATPAAFATDVSSGFDLFQTAPGAFFDATQFGLGIIPMVGRPLGPGPTDTIIQRDNGFQCSSPPCLGNTVNIHVFALSLESAAPINIGGSFFDVFADINDSNGLIPAVQLPQPDTLNPSTGTLTVDELTGSGGGFSSSLTVWADIIIAPVGTGPSFPGAAHMPAPAISLSSTGGIWQTTPPMNDLHDATYPAGDFYITSMGNHTGPHPVTPSTSPEPASSLLIATGALLLGAIGRRQIHSR